MSDVIIIRRTCTTCPTTEDSTTSEFETIKEATLALDGGAPVLLHFCTDCQAQFITPLLDLGVPVAPVKAAKAKEPKARQVGLGEFPCPDCGKVFTRSQGLGRHRTSGACKEVHLKVTPGTRRKKASA